MNPSSSPSSTQCTWPFYTQVHMPYTVSYTTQCSKAYYAQLHYIQCTLSYYIQLYSILCTEQCALLYTVLSSTIYSIQCYVVLYTMYKALLCIAVLYPARRHSPALLASTAPDKQLEEAWTLLLHTEWYGGSSYAIIQCILFYTINTTV